MTPIASVFVHAADAPPNRLLLSPPRATIHFQGPAADDDREEGGDQEANDQHRHTDLHGH